MGDISAHFNRSEFACKCGCGANTVDVQLISVLETIRSHFHDNPISIQSGHRCFKHNHSVDGASNSMHLIGRAADFVVIGVTAHLVQDLFEELYAGQYGMGRYLNFTHADTRDTHGRW